MGAAGFFGYHLTSALLARGDSVVGFDNLNDYYAVGLKKARLAQLDGLSGFTFVEGGLEDAVQLELVFETHAFDSVVNLAAQAGVRYSLENPRAYIDSNIVGFSNILECARQYQIKHLVYASSSSVYGMNRKVPFAVGDHVDHPVSLYAATKKADELMAHSYSHLFSIPMTGLRFFTVYGPWGRPDMAYYLFADAITRGEPIKVFNNGEMSRDFTYIDDVVEGLVRVIDKPATPEPGASSAPYRLFNIGNNNPVTLMDFISCIEGAFGKTAVKEMLPMQPGDVVSTYADIDELEEWVGYRPTTSIEQGITKFAEWYQAYYSLGDIA